MSQTASSEKKSRVYPIREHISSARTLATERTVRVGATLSLGTRLNLAADKLSHSPRIVQSQIRSLRKSLPELRKAKLPLAADGPCIGYLRTYELAVELCKETGNNLDLESIGAFVRDYQSAAPLTMGELWNLSPMLSLALLESLAEADKETAPAILGSLQTLSGLNWEDFFEEHSLTESILQQDPTGTYPRMTFSTRDQYRQVVGDLSAHSDSKEEAVAEAAIALARSAPKDSRQAHVGYYLVSDGLAHLRAGLAYRPTLRQRIVDFVRAWPTAFYLFGVELITLVLAAELLSYVHSHLTELALIVFLLSTEPAVAFMNLLTQALLPPRRLARMDFSDGIPAEYATMVVVPTLLLSEKFINQLIADLEIRFLANRDPNLTFALLTDFPDSQAPSSGDEHLIHFCVDAINNLNRRYGTDGVGPFYLFHRKREWNPKQGAWMGWERKRGKIIALNNFLRGTDDAFEVKTGNLPRASSTRFIITLDSDTELPRGTAQQLAGTMAHPLNRAVIDPVRNIVVSGYGILQPRVGISVSSARRSNLASIYSGQTGFDLYTTAVSDSYQDLFCEGSYCGKGIYDIDVFQKTLAKRFPGDMLLSHDLIEGSYARAGLVSDIEVIDDYPSHYSAWSKRKHRWVRGDWQIMHWLMPSVPGYKHRRVRNPLSVISHWKILDNLRRSLLEIGIFVLLVAGWTFLPGGPLYWTTVVTLLAFLPVYMRLGFSLIRTPLNGQWWSHLKEALGAFASGHLEVIFQLVFLVHQTCLMLDAIIRSVIRTTVTGRRLLEWESAAQAEMGSHPAFNAINSYLFLASPLSLLVGTVVALVNPRALIFAAPFLLAWLVSPLVALWLNSKLSSPGKKVRPRHRKFLKTVARRTWAFFETHSIEATHYLVPDNVRETDGFVDHRTSPTNMGLLLNAHLAAVDFGFITPEQCLLQVDRILTTLEKMETYRGHFFNWYDTTTLTAMPPRYVSTVDSGNLAASLLTLKRGMLELGSEALAERAAALFCAMDFSFLLDTRRKLFFIGFDAESGEFDNSHYGLLASEARIASFIGIAKNEIPLEHWMRLGRSLTIAGGHRVLLSWSGTMFEYLMPSLWLRNYGNTLLDRSARGAVKAQQEFGLMKGLPWGISESASAEQQDGAYRYYAFGLPRLALKPDLDTRHLVIAPYATALALMVDPVSAARNLRSVAKRGWLSRFGFYESADFTRDRARESVVKIYMAHHQGMSLIALDNALNRHRMQKRFHAEPMVKATELLLQERLSQTLRVEPALNE